MSAIPIVESQAKNVVLPDAGAGELLTADDTTFAAQWRAMTHEQRETLPEDIRGRCYDRYRKLTPYIADSIKRAERINGAKHKAESADEFAGVKTAGDVMRADAAPVAYCVPGRVPCGLVIIGGRPKSRKSWYALQLVIAKSAGGQFMGVEIPAGRCLYVALEDNDRRMRQRLEFFGLAPDTAPANLHLVYEWDTGVSGIEKLERWLTQFPDTALIVVDVLQRFRGPRDNKASAYESDYQMMAMLHGVTQRHVGLTLLVVHHVRKGAVEDPVEALNGTFAIAGAADAYIILRRGEGQQWIAHVDGRDWEAWEHEFAWEFKPQEGWCQVGVSEGDLTATQQEIVRFARDNDFITPTKLAEFRQIRKSTAHEALRTLVDKGAMRVFGGKYYPTAE